MTPHPKTLLLLSCYISTNLVINKHNAKHKSSDSQNVLSCHAYQPTDKQPIIYIDGNPVSFIVFDK